MFDIETIASDRDTEWAITTLLDLYPGEITEADREIMEEALVLGFDSKLEYLLFHHSNNGIKDPKNIELRELITCLHRFPKQSIIVTDDDKVYCIVTEDLDKLSGYVIKAMSGGINPEIWTHLDRH